MLIIKRIAATIINILIFVSCIFAIYPLLLYFDINISKRHFLLLIFIITFFIPIILLKTSLGNYILTIKTSSRNKELIKSFIYYLFISGVIVELLEIFNNSFVPLDIIFISISLFIVSNVLFFYTKGSYNFIDFILSLHYVAAPYHKKYIWLSYIWLNFIFLFFSLSFFSKEQDIENTLRESLSLITDTHYQGYFPKEIFNEYSFGEFIEYSTRTDIISPTHMESFYQPISLTEKNIYASINKQTFLDETARYNLCLELYKYSYYADIFEYKKDKDITQTKFYLTYYEPFTFFSTKTYTYIYYLNKINDSYSLSGGIDFEYLYNTYEKQIDTYHLLVSERICEEKKDSIFDAIKNFNPYTLSVKDTPYILHQLSVLNNKYTKYPVINFFEAKPKKVMQTQLSSINNQIGETVYSLSKLDKKLMQEDKQEDAVILRNFYHDIIENLIYFDFISRMQQDSTYLLDLIEYSNTQ